MKPRIRRWNGLWECVSLDCKGWPAATPQDAYWLWATLRRRQASVTRR